MVNLVSADLIRAARAMLNLTQQELAEASGLERRIVARLETVQGSVKIQQFVQVRIALERRGIEFTAASESYGAGLRWRTPKDENESS